MKKGKVYLVGSGPGDIGLFTLKGKAVLETADVVIYDALIGAEVLSLANDNAELIYVGKRGGNHTKTQAEINEIIHSEALKGKTVVRLKGGDPFLFGRGGEELSLLAKDDIPFEIVNGITSPIAVPAYAGIPITHREFVSSLHIITAHTKEGEGSSIDFTSLVKLKGTLVFLMGVSSLNLICEGLLSAGMAKDMPCAIIENGTNGNQRSTVSTLSQLKADADRVGVKSPAIIVVGEVCSLRESFAWREKMPLFGKRVVVTRPKELNSTFSEKLRQGGAQVIELPAIKTKELPFYIEREELINADVIAFTSAFGVKTFFEKLKEQRIDIRALVNAKFAAVGKMTAREIEKHGVLVEFMPKSFSGKELGEIIKTDGKVMIFRAKNGAEGLTEALSTRGISYEDVAVYETIPCEINPAAKKEIQNGVDYLCFTSASTVKSFIDGMQGEEVLLLPALCIGKQTASEAEKYGFKEIHISKEATIQSMAEYIGG